MAQKTKVKELVGRGLNSYHTKSLQQIDRIEKKNKEQNHKISILSNELDNDYLTKTEEGSVISLEHSKEGMVYLDELQGNTLVNYCTNGSKEMTLNGDIDIEGTFVTTTEGVDNGKVDVMCEGNTEKVTNSNMICWLDSSNYVNGTISDNTKNNNYANVQGNIEYGDSGILADRISIPNITTLPTSFTIDIRTSLHELGTESIIAKRTSISNGFFVFYYQGKLCYDFNGSENRHQTNVGLQPNILYRITFVVDNNKSKLYLDGNLIHEATHSFTYKDVEKPIDILYDSSNVSSYVREGKLVGLKVYNKALTKEEILLDEGYKLQSVGQDDENGHKIEILSQNKNLFDKNSDINFISNTGNNFNRYKQVESDYIRFKYGGYGIGVYFTSNINKLSKGTYTLSCECYCGSENSSKDISIGYRINNSNKPTSIYKLNSYNTWEKIIHTFTISEETDIEGLIIQSSGSSQNYTDIDFRIKNIQLERNAQSTEYIPYALNKKEILLNEPLRGLPNDTIKDKFVKIGGKWYIERNYSEVIIGKENDYISIHGTFTYNGVTYTRFRFEIDEPISNIEKSTTKVSYGISDKFKVLTVQANAPYTLGTKAHHVDGGVGKMIIYGVINETTTTISLAKEYLANNKVSLVYKLEKPTYEEITDVTLSTYLDITHISNNSIIPCNMKIKNSGYNAIIKPSTLYTVALDTNKSGTIGMNLGGAKGTTTNNVAIITTPATLTDDSLRLYGKGIKGSKVRLLEGDKTNWIPSFFEGMKSSFEDKFDATDNTYKMEILMNNENLFDINEFVKGYSTKDIVGYVENGVRLKSNSWAGHERIGFKVEPYTTYKVTFTIKKENDEVTPNFEIYESNTTTASYFWTTSVGTHTRTFTTKGNTEVFIRMDTSQLGYSEYSNVSISKISSNFVPQQSNKIQFSSIEPLRGVDSTKDRFVFKDGKLMIERNCSELIIDDTNPYSISGNNSNYPNILRIWYSDSKLPNWKPAKSLCNTLPSYGNMSENMIGIGYSNGFDIHLPLSTTSTISEVREYLKNNPLKVVHQLKEPTYEEIPFELQKIILEGYENGTLFFDTNIPPTSTVTYAGETPIVKATKLNKTEVLNNTNDINDNIIPYLMDMDYRVVCLQLQSEISGLNMARLFGGTYEMLQRDIQSKRYSIDEYKHRLDAYLDANKITEEEYNKLGDMLNE